MEKLLFSFSLPAFLGMFASGIYNIVDTIFISKGVGILAVGGVGIVYPIQTLYVAFAQMISIGAASAISRSLGEKNESRANQNYNKFLRVNLNNFHYLNDFNLSFYR